MAKKEDGQERTSALSLLQNTAKPQNSETAKSREGQFAVTHNSENALPLESDSAVEQSDELAETQNREVAKVQSSETTTERTSGNAKPRSSESALAQNRVSRGVTLFSWLFKQYKVNAAELDTGMHLLMEEALIAYLPTIQERLKAKKRNS